MIADLVGWVDKRKSNNLRTNNDHSDCIGLHSLTQFTEFLNAITVLLFMSAIAAYINKYQEERYKFDIMPVIS